MQTTGGDNNMIQENIKLKNYTTLRLGGSARYFSTIQTESDLLESIDFAFSKKLPILPLGVGSNIIVSDKLKDLVVFKMENKGIEIIKENKDEVFINVSSGEIWDDFVNFSVQRDFLGIEAMSAIPGTVGATPVQNVGAYGQEVKNVISEVRGFNLENKKFEIINADQCNFSYRDSVFKNGFKNKFIIQSVIFKLNKETPIVSNYSNVAQVLELVKSEHPEMSELEGVRRAIQKIRGEKLPNPMDIANVGSFFKNVLVDKTKIEELRKKFPEMPFFENRENYKIPTGWLIEKAGFNGVRKGDVGVYEKNALVLVNYSSVSSVEILDLANDIKEAVRCFFGIKIDIEPEIIM